MVNHAIESSSQPAGVKIGLDNRAMDFAKVTDAPPPPADAPADAPLPAAKVDYAFVRYQHTLSISYLLLTPSRSATHTPSNLPRTHP